MGLKMGPMDICAGGVSAVDTSGNPLSDGGEIECHAPRHPAFEAGASRILQTRSQYGRLRRWHLNDVADFPVNAVLQNGP